MNKFLKHFILFVSVLFVIWFVLSQANLREIIRLESRLESAETKIGELVLKAFLRENRQVADSLAVAYLNQHSEHLATSNGFEPESVEMYLVKNKDVNAFALPGRKMVIFTGLVEFCEEPEEFFGVIAHEFAHIENSHVTKKLSKEIGIGVVFALLSGNYGAEIAKNLLKILTSTAYDRNLEREADRVAIEYLIQAEINPRSYIKLLERFDEELASIPSELQWISTHPNSAERAMELEILLKEKSVNHFQEMDKNTWNEFKSRL